MQTRKVLMGEYDAISETDRIFRIRKLQEVMVHIHSDGTRRDIPGRAEYLLPGGERLLVLDSAHPDAPELFERTTTFEHLRIMHQDM